MSAPMIPYSPARIETQVQLKRATAFLDEMDGRRSVRFFSDEPVPRELIELAIRTASTAPSGAHKQPWTYVVTGDPVIKRQIRQAAEREERVNYQEGRLPEHWREDLEPLGTDWHKPFLETVPWVVVLFEQRYGVREDGERSHHYYVKESVGISAGLFIVALHHMGLATLTHTPSPMKFLSRVLGRPENERPFCLFPIGYPANDCVVPQLTRKGLDQVMVEVGSAT
ncbi:MAG: nitroreductase family protein [Acidimicrobiia bacterium]|jgi:iodotyrosine deiodinase